MIVIMYTRASLLASTDKSHLKSIKVQLHQSQLTLTIS